MSNFLIGISGIAAVIAGLIAIIDMQSIWFWVFVILSIPFAILLSASILIAIGQSPLSIFDVLDQLGEDSEDE